LEYPDVAVFIRVTLSLSLYKNVLDAARGLLVQISCV
jgi:hypothetical protein